MTTTCAGVHRCPPLPPIDGVRSAASITAVADLLGAATIACDCVAQLRRAVADGPDTSLTQLVLLAWRLAHAVGVVDQQDAHRVHVQIYPELSTVFDALLAGASDVVLARIEGLNRERRHDLTIWAVAQITRRIAART